MKQMMVRTRQVTKALVLTSLVGMGACEVSDQMVGPEEPPTVVLGRVASVSSSTDASGSAAASSLGGIEVTVQGGTAADVTAADGSFRLEVDGNGGPIRLRFRRGSLDVEMELSGIPAGGELRIRVRLDDSGATVLDDEMDEGPDEFEGSASLLSVDGEASTRIAQVELKNAMGSTRVKIEEGVTTFDAEGDIRAFDDLLAALDASTSTIRIEGRGTLGAEGVFSAVVVKVEVDEDDATADDDGLDDDPRGFDGVASLLSLKGEAPARTVLVELEGALGPTLVQVVEGVTLFDAEGDVLAFADLLAALDRSDGRVRIEGDGSLGADGIFVATEIKVEIDESA